MWNVPSSSAALKMLFDSGWRHAADGQAKVGAGSLADFAGHFFGDASSSLPSLGRGMLSRDVRVVAS